ncbi:hypothetical protein BGZ63DRAFT_424997 [Mariannaea sp. PMI_226]|nr:hypothetical protein BGZ63DRAFT_424997 [Mariannaea sp. PMI_226]
MKTPPNNISNVEQHRGPIGQPALFRLDKTSNTRWRIVFKVDGISIWGWPSRGGLIVLERVTALDFDFLCFDPVDLIMHRDTNQDAEDQLCQRLLLLGAKWFDSGQRQKFVAGVADDDDRDIIAIQAKERAPPSKMERRWVSVAHIPEGGFWIVEFDTYMYGIQEKHNLVPGNAAQVQLARNMPEKAEILKRISAKFYASLDEYSEDDGEACLNAWKTKSNGELGPLLKE